MSDFTGARLKIQRAESQATKLAEEFTEFFSTENRANAIAVHRNADAREWWGVMKVLKPPPEMWPVQVGEVVHNLRSALDHIIFEASTPGLAGIEFPIFLHEKAYRSTSRGGGLYKIRGLSPKAKTIVKRCQPFVYGEPDRQFLWILHELSNADKHRLLNFATTYDIESEMTLRWEPSVRGLEWIRSAPTGNLEGEAEVFRVRVVGASTDTKLHVDGHHTFQILFDEATPAAAKLPVWEVLEGAGKLVGAIRTEFAKL